MQNKVKCIKQQGIWPLKPSTSAKMQWITRSVGKNGREARYNCLLSPRAFRSLVKLISSMLKISFVELGFKSP